ncbi:hypothetical protein HMN09_00298600 [Mycena chlorophos]|uniref:F-box domain-containing protein n=1 Tax=Mycena chlorophos TaxID=658473 RepID=A0A8H6TPU0_MYCCL|nr:hypothetical protein HMN09_00298600 [Mycena chlorophos]
MSAPSPDPRSQLPEFLHLLTANEAPTTLEQTTLRSLLEDYQLRADCLNAEIDHLEASLGYLKAERDRVQAALVGVQTALSPVRQLPAELIAEIFLWVLKGYRPERRTRAPWHLGHVCRAWRNIALTLPRLWSKIVVYVASNPGDVTALGLREQQIEEQLARSQQFALSVEIIWSTPVLHLFDASARLVGLVAEHCERWRSLSLSPTSDLETLLAILEPVQNRLPNLEKLEYQYREQTRAGMRSDLFRHAPKLSKLRYMARDSVLHIPWPQIRHCYLQRRFRDLLAAHNLVNLDLGMVDETLQLAPGQFIILPNLLHLHSRFAWAMRSFTTPILQSLQLGLALNLDEIPQFLRRSACPLTALMIQQEDQGDAIDMDDVVKILRCVPSLTLFIVDISPAILAPVPDGVEHDLPTLDTLFSALTVTGTLADIVPNLSTFIYALPYDPFATDSFLQMAASRETASIGFCKRILRSRRDIVNGRNIKRMRREEVTMVVRNWFPVPRPWIR